MFWPTRVPKLNDEERKTRETKIKKKERCLGGLQEVMRREGSMTRPVINNNISGPGSCPWTARANFWQLQTVPLARAGSKSQTVARAVGLTRHSRHSPFLPWQEHPPSGSETRELGKAAPWHRQPQRKQQEARRCLPSRRFFGVRAQARHPPPFPPLSRPPTQSGRARGCSSPSSQRPKFPAQPSWSRLACPPPGPCVCCLSVSVCPSSQSK